MTAYKVTLELNHKDVKVILELGLEKMSGMFAVRHSSQTNCHGECALQWSPQSLQR